MYGFQKNIGSLEVYGDRLATRQNFKYVDCMGGIYSPYRLVTEEKHAAKGKRNSGRHQKSKTKEILREECKAKIWFHKSAEEVR